LPWLLALCAAVHGTCTRGLLRHWFDDELTFVFALPAVVQFGWFAGTLPAAVAALLSVAWLLLPWVEPTLSPAQGWRPALHFLPSALMLGFFASRLGVALTRGAAPLALEQRGGLRWLWAVVLLGGAVPLALLIAAAARLYRQVFVESNLRVERAARVGEEHALKVIETDIALTNRILDVSSWRCTWSTSRTARSSSTTDRAEPSRLSATCSSAAPPARPSST